MFQYAKDPRYQHFYRDLYRDIFDFLLSDTSWNQDISAPLFAANADLSFIS